MYTQCPNCQTVFRVGAQQLRAAAGKVRCGRCSEIFDALAYRTAWEPKDAATDDLPLSSPAPDPSGHVDNRGSLQKANPTRTEPKRSSPLKEEKKPKASERRPTVQKKTAAPPSPARPNSPRKSSEKPKNPTKQRGTDQPQTAARPTESNRAAPQYAKRPTNQSRRQAQPADGKSSFSPNGPETARNEPKRRPTVQPQTAAPKIRPTWSDEGAESLETGPDHPTTPSVESGTTEKPTKVFRDKRNDSGPKGDSGSLTEGNIRSQIRSTEERTEPPASGPGTTTGQTRSAQSAVGVQSSDTEPSGPKETRRGASKEHQEPRPSQVQDEIPAEPPRPTDNEELPLQLQTRSNSGHGIGPTLVWSIAVLLAVAVLGGQYAYFNRDRLALHNEWRPYLERLCETAGCDLPPRRELSAVELVDHAVQSHPRQDGALLITATLLNGADFPQPYPDVEVMMMDVEQNPVASRHFTPAEYLAGRSSDNLFAAGREAHVVLEVVDPGPQAVSFEFGFR